MNKTEALKIIDKVGTDFGWQMGKVGANYENGYMQAIRDCKAAFYKMTDHFGEVNKIVEVNEEIKCMLKDCIYSKCSMSECAECEFFNKKDTTDGIYFCAIRDKKGNIPYWKDWDIESAFMKEKVE